MIDCRTCALYEKSEYYFITYAWKHKGSSEWNYENDFIDQSPIKWLMEIVGNVEDYRLLNYEPITKEEYLKYEGKL